MNYVFHPDKAEMVDWVFKNNYLSFQSWTFVAQEPHSHGE